VLDYRSIGDDDGEMWEKLAEAVKARRDELGLAQTDIGRLGGPSPAIVSAIENNRATQLTPRLRRGLDEALQWETGSVSKVLAGGHATPINPTSPTDPGIADPERWGGAAPLIAKVEQVQLALNGLTFDVRETDLRDPAVVDWITRSVALMAFSQADILRALSVRLAVADADTMMALATAYSAAANVFRDAAGATQDAYTELRKQLG
jgi:peptidoglycan hydrolase-like protein with peptidoglycan-binding domain